MMSFILKTLRFGLLAFSLAALAYQSASSASVALPPGSGPTALVGTTALGESDLGGTVLYDKLLPFSIRGPGGAILFVGSLQNRVVKSARTGTLHFYYRIRNTKAGLNGIIKEVITNRFNQFPDLMVDWRPDGLGNVNPFSAERSPGAGTQISFSFNPTGSPILVGGEESKFFYIKTKAKKHLLNGRTMIHLTTGEMANLQTAVPSL